MENLIYLEEVDSTNTYVKKRLGELEDRTVVYTSRQTHGRGRMEHTWFYTGTENIYIIRFTSAIDDPNQYPSSDDVCLVQVENGVWRASSIRKDVIVFLFNVAGQRIDSGVVPVIDPNEKDFMCEPSSTVTGREFRLPKQGTVYVFAFTYQGIILRSQKVIY